MKVHSSAEMFTKITPWTLLLWGVFGFLGIAFVVARMGSGIALGFLLYGIYLCAMGFIAGYLYFSMERVLFRLGNQPIVYTDAAVPGDDFAGRGKIFSDEYLIAPHTQRKCLYYHFIKEKRVKTRSGHRWEEIANTVKYVPIILRDYRGDLAIDLANIDHDHSEYLIEDTNTHYKDFPYSQIHAEPVAVHEEITEAYSRILSFFSIEKVYRVTEWVLDSGTTYNVFGHVYGDQSAKTLREGKDSPLVLTYMDHRDFLAQYEKGRALIYCAPFTFVVGLYLCLLFSLLSGLISQSFFGLMGIIFMGAYAFVVSISVFNRMAVESERILHAQGNLQGELQRRHDLITSLQDAVKDYTKHESQVLIELTAQRLIVSQVDRVQDHPFSFGASPKMIAEAYPELEADTVFSELIHHLSDTEKRIAYMRDFYNKNVKHYNAYIEMFPHSLVARAVGYTRHNFFEIMDVHEKSVPEVKIG